MAATREFGTVVAGLGIAGGVRVRDLKEKLCGLKLQGVVSRRSLVMPDVTVQSLDEALSRDEVECVIISTENKTHEEYVQRSLESGKHVLVDYPVALSSAKAKELYELAEQKGLVLWEENIALLTEAHQQLKAKAQQSEIKSVIYSLSGSYNGWIENFEESGPPFTSGVSSIQTMIDLFGDLTVLDGKLDKVEDGFTAKASLETQSKKPIEITYTRTKSKEAHRKKSGVYEFMDGEVMDLDKMAAAARSSAKSVKPGLFMQDMLNFYQAVLNGKNDKAAQERSIKSLETAEKIHALF